MTFRRLPFFMLLALLLVNVAPLAAQDEVECEEGFRPFEHFVETTCIPVQPERIAAIPSDLVATPLLDFGAPVIATNFGEQEDGTIYVRGASDILGEATVEEANLISLGTTAFNFEVLLEANPDLIIGMSFSEDLYDQLSAIAPTILIEWPTPVFEHLELIADAAGISGVYDEQLAEYEARIAEARERIGDPASITISRLDIAADGIWYYPDTGALEQVIADIGFSQPEIQANATEALVGVSIEEIRAFDGDIIVSSYAPRFGQTIENLESGWFAQGDSLWLTLPGVEAGNHYWFERDIWRGTTFTSLYSVIDGLTLLTAGRDFD